MSNQPYIYISKKDDEQQLVSVSERIDNLLPNSRPVYENDGTEKYISFADKSNCFHFHHGRTIVENNSEDFLPHYHPVYEIFIYISGKADYQIETAVFRLNPFDIIIVPPYTIHQPLPEEGEVFERYVINIFPEFFSLMDCDEYKDAFLTLPGMKYKIPGHIVQRSDIGNIIEFFGKKYSKADKYTKPLLNYKIAELLYCINTINFFEGYDSVNSVVQEMIAYIDNNFDSITNLSNVTDNFYYSKNYLSRLFKKSTGITIPRYVNIKKMEYVEKLYNRGKSLTRACVEAGFGNYDNFAYSYKAEFGISPRKGFGKRNRK